VIDLLALRLTMTVLKRRKLMRYIRQYNKSPRIVKWKYADPSRHIGTKMSCYRLLGQARFGYLAYRGA
jgi:hypothetical protein